MAETAVPKRALDPRYRQIRAQSEMLCEPLETEDYVIQSMPDVSPTKWHLAHTSWFFQTFVLPAAGIELPDIEPTYAYLFNSYYNAVGPRHCRPLRGLLSRPTVDQVYAYRHLIDDAMGKLFERGVPEDVMPLIEVGLQHEQQHQELMLTDIKHVFSSNPLDPMYRALPAPDDAKPRALGWCRYDEQVTTIGIDPGSGFAFDNEHPLHRVLIHPFELADRLVTCGEYLEFMDDGGYEQASLWLSEGWATAQSEHWQAPLYWRRAEDGWQLFTLAGVRKVAAHEPVCHLSYFEASAFAEWAGCRLPREAEWELAARGSRIDGNFVEQRRYHPQALRDETLPSNGPLRDVSAGSRPSAPAQMFGDVWEWTMSAYAPYPGYRPLEGALGEYNGKFMCNQFVLRGGSCATPESHIRPTYRNFFPPDARWQFTGLRLARDA
ncbi:MAG: ergothioneine biosynthesis protein EgtB [Acidobacteriota bacterium]